MRSTEIGNRECGNSCFSGTIWSLMKAIAHVITTKPRSVTFAGAIKREALNGRCYKVKVVCLVGLIY